jgi:putative transposase
VLSVLFCKVRSISERRLRCTPGGVCSLGLHLVWCPKYRRRNLCGRVAARCGQLLEQIAAEHGWKIVAKEVMADHVHLFVRVDPTDAPAQVVRAFKGRTARKAACGVPASAPVREGVVVAVVFRRLGRLRLGVHGASLHRTPAGRGGVVRRAYVFRLRPTARQHVTLAACVDAHRELYNAALQERRDGWSHSKTRIRYGDQSAQLTEIRSVRPDQAVWSFSSQQATLRRLNKSFDGFFRRVKAGRTPGYPRFKAKARFDSVEWPKDGDGARWLPESRRVYLQGVGQVKVHLHRQIEGRVKTIQVKRQGRRWMLVLSCADVPTKPLPATGGQVGVDVGVVTYATLSDGTAVANPRWARQEARRLEVAQHRLQRAKRGSNNRVARRETVAARHRKIANRRKDFHHKQVRELAARYDLLVVEDLVIANMLRRAKPNRRHRHGHLAPGEPPLGHHRR